MYLKRMELQGFKSFADKTVLEFNKGITAVIGPNGSGKSNISDAIRWVLGEQSIKTLRGSKLEDVIFAGTQARKSVSYAEVDITMDNGDGKLPVEYSEVTITRRVYRSGESEFFINKNQCRLKDIVELFMDTGIGRDGYSIIGQGRIDEILSTKSEERRSMFEEAAGIVKYRTRKEEAEKKLENTRLNLVRINDIVCEIEGQLGPLSEQSEKARKFLEIHENLKQLEIGLFINNINKNREKLEEIARQIEEVAGQYTEEEQKLTILQQNKENLRVEIEELISKTENVQSLVFEAQKSIEKQRADIGVYTERIQNNELNFEKYKEEIEKLNTRKIELQQEKEDRIAKKERLSNDRTKFQIELSEKEGLLKELTDGLTAEQKHIEEIKSTMMANIDLKFEKMEELKNIGADAEAGTRRLKQIDDEIRENILDIDREKIQREDEQTDLNSISKGRNELKEKIEGLSKLQLEYNANIKRYEDDIRTAQNDISVKESRYKFLIETENEFEGYNKAVKDILSKCKKDKDFSKNIYGAVANLIDVPHEYETAIELALGASLQNVVTETEDDAKRAIEFLKANNLGRASFLPITAVKGNRLTDNLKNEEGFIGVASDLINYDKKYENVVLSLLGRTVITSNMDCAIKISKKHKYGFRIVTLDGDIVNISGQMTGGSTYKKTTSILGRSREIAELSEGIKDLKTKYNKLLNDFEEYKLSVENSYLEFSQAEQEIQEVNISFAAQTEKLSARDANIDRLNKRIESLKIEKDKISSSSENEKASMLEIQELIASIEAQNTDIQNIVKEFSIKNEEQQKIIDDLNTDVVDLKISVSSFDESSSSIDEIIERIDLDIQNSITSAEKRTEDRGKIVEENEKMRGSIDLANEEIQKIMLEISDLEKNVDLHKREREEKNSILVNVESTIEAKFKTLDILREQSNKLDVRKTKIDMDIETIQNKMWEDYEVTLNTAKNYLEVTPTTAKEVDKCKAEIKSLGNVNVNAIDEYKSLKDRYEFLMLQKGDLENSEKSINKIIADMIDIMKIQFTQQFELINKNFSGVFAELFGGGHAELRLSDTNDVLQSGIEIDVQPPGKKLQNMMLLSGGERALTAIALLFAILKLNPSPFCVLDEIEAALDEVNVYRFSDYLKKFSQDTQFLVITHRKGTMESASSIYGVTMQEHGISKLISMKL